MADEFDKAYWEGHYRGQHAPPHDQPPNQTLVDTAGALAPGRALDAGCGHGADARWLAAHGWRVTAVDVSATVLAAARDRGATLGTDTAARITWIEADVATWSPPEERFDLVTSHFVHVPAALGATFVRQLAAAVAPGGVLLFVGHDAAGVHEGVHTDAAEAYVTVAEVAAQLDPAQWQIDVAETRSHTTGGRHQHQPVRRDAVLRARRAP